MTSSSHRPHIDTNRIRSFGRVKSRKLNPKQEQLLAEVLPPIAVGLPEENQQLEFQKLFLQAPEKMVLEIGFGGGEHLAGIAARHACDGFVGCEPFTNGVASLLSHIDDQQLNNIRVFHGDARVLLERSPDACFDKVYVLFPDPWPKAKHHKKRIINDETLTLLHRVMKPGAVLTIATDHVDYSEWISEHLGNRTDFKEIDRDRNAPPEGWVPTRYQQKAALEGREPVFFVVER